MLFRSLTQCGIAFGHRHKASDRVANKVEVTGRVGGAELNLPCTSRQLRDDGGDHCASRLPGAIGVERTNDRHWRLEGQKEAGGDLVRADLAGGVRRLALQGVFFGDGHKARRAIDLAGGGVDHALYTQFSGCLDDVERALDVGSVYRLSRL